MAKFIINSEGKAGKDYTVDLEKLVKDMIEIAKKMAEMSEEMVKRFVKK
jgi:hypothetical protein